MKLRFGEDGSEGVTIAAVADVGDTEGQVEAALEGDAVVLFEGDLRLEAFGY